MSISPNDPSYDVIIVNMGDTDGQTAAGRQIKQQIGFLQVTFRDSSNSPVNNVQLQVAFGNSNEDRLTLDYNGQVGMRAVDVTRVFWNNTPGVYAHIVVSPDASLFQNDCPNPLQTFSSNVGTTAASAAVTVGTSATLLSAASTGRQSVVIANNDPGVVLYVGNASVTTSNGLPIQPNGSATFDKSSAAIYGIVASGSLDARTFTESI